MQTHRSALKPAGCSGHRGVRRARTCSWVSMSMRSPCKRSRAAAACWCCRRAIDSCGSANLQRPVPPPHAPPHACRSMHGGGSRGGASPSLRTAAASRELGTPPTSADACPGPPRPAPGAGCGARTWCAAGGGAPGPGAALWPSGRMPAPSPGCSHHQADLTETIDAGKPASHLQAVRQRSSSLVCSGEPGR